MFPKKKEEKGFLFPGAEAGISAQGGLSFPGASGNKIPKGPLFSGAENAIELEGNFFPGIKLSLPDKCYKINDQQKQLMMISISFETSGSQLSAKSVEEKGEKEKIDALSELRVNEDLGVLLDEVCLLVNCVAYPERVTKFELAKKKGAFEARVDWSEDTLNSGQVGKSLKGRLMRTSNEYSP